VREDLPTLARWQAEAGRVALATVVATSRSAPTAPGATLALHPDGRLLGSVSGGCVEGAVAELAAEVLASGIARVARYGISDAEAFSVGLTCGGTLEVLVRTVGTDDLPLGEVADRVAADEPVAVVAVVAHADRPDLVGRGLLVTSDGARGSVGGTALTSALVRAARGALAAGVTGIRRLGGEGEEMGGDVAAFIQVLAPRPRMIVVGAVDHAAAVVTIGRFLGFHVTVCDARAPFATRERFPDADEVVVDQPHRLIRRAPIDERSAVCILTHDPKFDVPAVVAALGTTAGYVGAMGSRRTHDDRMRRLREAGVAEPELSRLRSPIGLDLGGRTPQETAVAIAAELVALRHGGSGRALRETDGPIHTGRATRATQADTALDVA
jgi:xanthine dehydrogenase accessory factor